MEKDYGLRDAIRIFYKKGYILSFTFIGFIFIGIILAFVMPRNYTSGFKLLPPVATNVPGQELWAALVQVSMQSGGFYLGGEPSAFIKDFVLSRRVIYAVIDSLDLVEVLGKRTREDCYESLLDRIKVKINESGMLEVNVVTNDPKLSYSIAQSLLSETFRALQESLENLGMGVSKFLKSKLDEVKHALDQAEEQLKTFQEKHKTVKLPVELEKVVQKISDLKSEYLSTKVELEMLKRYATPHTASIKELEAKAEALANKLNEMEERGGENLFGPGFAAPLSELPEISLQYARLETEVRVYRSLYEFVRSAYERAKFYETQQRPLVEVLDYPVVPTRGKPRKVLIIGLSMVLGFFMGTALVFISNYVEFVFFEHPEGRQLFNEFHRSLIYRMLIK